MATITTPPDWSSEESELVQALAACGSHSVVGPPDCRLVAAGWLAAWTDEAGVDLVTFTPLAARSFGLTLDGDPARWMGHAESRALEAPRGKSSGKVVTETDLNAARERAGGSRKVVGDDAENRRVGTGDGWRSREHGGLSSPTLILSTGRRGAADWDGALVGPCPVCVPRGGVRNGEYCARCDRHWMDHRLKPGARSRRVG